MKTSHSFTALLLLALAFGGVQSAPAQSPNVNGESRDMVRAVRNPDGTRSIYTRHKGSGMQCATYTASGQLAAILDYIEGTQGKLMGCIVYDCNRAPIYKVAYGYDSKARLIEERMYTMSDKKLVQRVIYRYDAAGNRSKPIIVSVSASSVRVAPTAEQNVNNINQDLRRRSGQR